MCAAIFLQPLLVLKTTACESSKANDQLRFPGAKNSKIKDVILCISRGVTGTGDPRKLPQLLSGLRRLPMNHGEI